MTVKDICLSCGLDILCESDITREVSSVYAGDLLSWVMGHGECGEAWVTIMSNQNVLAVASLLDFSCVILSENVIPDEEFLSIAKDKGINILSSKESTYKVCTRLFSALGK